MGSEEGSVKRRGFLKAGLFGAAALLSRDLYSGDSPVEFVSDLDHPWEDGLYSTITGVFCMGGKPKGMKKVKLDLKGAKEPLDCRAVITDKNNPLVVLVNGTSSLAENSLSCMWMSWLEQRGINSFSYDSTMHPLMARKWGGGVLGNLEKESEFASKIIDGFLKQEKIQPSKIGLVGVSYGGVQALLLSKQAVAGTLLFKVDAVQAYSPPVSMEDALGILDSNFKSPPALTELAAEFYNLPRKTPMQKSFNRENAQIALSRVFYMTLTDIVLKNDDVYGGWFEKKTGKPRLVPMFEYEGGRKVECDLDRRKLYAESVSFGRYVRDFLTPYWQANGYDRDIMACGELKNLLSECQEGSEVIVSKNDPLNSPGAVDRLSESKYKGRLIVLPRGGHVGYADSAWTRRKIQSIFDKK